MMNPLKNTEPIKKKKMYVVSAHQFGKTFRVELISAKDRESAIKKFKKKYYFRRGYLIKASLK